MIYKIICSLFFYTTALLTFCTIGPLFIFLSVLVPSKYYVFARITSQLMLFSLGIRVKIINYKYYSDPQIYMFNHSSFIDPFLFAYCITDKSTGVVAKEIYKYPIFGHMLKAYKAIPIDRKNKSSAINSITQAEKTLKQGINIIILPEGTRTTTGYLKPFKKGGFHMAINTQSLIIPIGSIGAYKFKPKNSWLLNPCTVTLKYGEPELVTNYDKLGVDGLLKLYEKKFVELTGKEFKDEKL